MALLQSELSKLKRKGAEKIRARTSGQNTLKCLVKGCGFETNGNLMIHVNRIHGMSRDQYLIMHRLPYDTRLYGANSRIASHYERGKGRK